MNKNIFIEKLFKKAKELKIEEFEVYYMSGENTTVKVFDSKIDSFSDNTNQGISFRGKFQDKMGYSYSESFEEEDIMFLINEAKENASIIENTDEQIIFGEKCEYKETETYSKELEDITVDDMKDFLFKMESYVKSLDKRIKNINNCTFVIGKGERVIKNSKGIDLRDEGNFAYTVLSISVMEKDKIKTAYDFKIGKRFSDFDYKKLGDEVVKKAISKLDVINVSLDNDLCVVENLTFASLLGSMLGNFYAESVQKGISKLKGKLNEVIANENITLIDDPFLKDGYSNSSFDAEGVPTEYKEIIKDGVLKTYLYNLKTAKKDGVKSTGNASKGGYKGTIGTSCYNLYLKNGETSLEDLFKEIGNGVYITSFAGLHSGLNSISGDFSLAGEGFYIKDGKLDKGLNQITIAGNFYELLNNIKKLGNDFKFDSSGIGCPSLLIKGLNIESD
ncbi:MAG: TldD/PmbA family protein [Fusobacterium sp. JB021]|nr:TldD/PmbA family protein [Fusobacterium sp. JB021]MDP0506086.1 TldD/PmbA family protein [Fusobacterium sp. JB019]